MPTDPFCWVHVLLHEYLQSVPQLGCSARNAQETSDTQTSTHSRLSRHVKFVHVTRNSSCKPATEDRKTIPRPYSSAWVIWVIPDPWSRSNTLQTKHHSDDIRDIKGHWRVCGPVCCWDDGIFVCSPSRWAGLISLIIEYDFWLSSFRFHSSRLKKGSWDRAGWLV